MLKASHTATLQKKILSNLGDSIIPHCEKQEMNKKGGRLVEIKRDGSFAVVRVDYPINAYLVRRTDAVQKVHHTSQWAQARATFSTLPTWFADSYGPSYFPPHTNDETSKN